MSQQLVPVLVTIKNGVVDGVTIARDEEHLEELFLKENQDYGREPHDAEYENGYAELEDVTICMTWANKE